MNDDTLGETRQMPQWEKRMGEMDEQPRPVDGARCEQCGDTTPCPADRVAEGGTCGHPAFAGPIEQRLEVAELKAAAEREKWLWAAMPASIAEMFEALLGQGKGASDARESVTRTLDQLARGRDRAEALADERLTWGVTLGLLATSEPMKAAQQVLVDEGLPMVRVDVLARTLLAAKAKASERAGEKKDETYLRCERCSHTLPIVNTPTDERCRCGGNLIAIVEVERPDADRREGDGARRAEPREASRVRGREAQRQIAEHEAAISGTGFLVDGVAVEPHRVQIVKAPTDMAAEFRRKFDAVAQNWRRYTTDTQRREGDAAAPEGASAASRARVREAQIEALRPYVLADDGASPDRHRRAAARALDAVEEAARGMEQPARVREAAQKHVDEARRLAAGLGERDSEEALLHVLDQVEWCLDDLGGEPGERPPALGMEQPDLPEPMADGRPPDLVSRMIDARDCLRLAGPGGPGQQGVAGARRWLDEGIEEGLRQRELYGALRQLVAGEPHECRCIAGCSRVTDAGCRFEKALRTLLGVGS